MTSHLYGHYVGVTHAYKNGFSGCFHSIGLSLDWGFDKSVAYKYLHKLRSRRKQDYEIGYNTRYIWPEFRGTG